MVMGWRVRLKRPEAQRPREVPPRYRVKERPPSNRKKWFGWLLPLLVLGGIPSFLWIKGYGVIEARGVVEGRIVKIGTPFEGVLAEVSVTMGDRVEKGQVLARIDTRELEAVVREKEGRVAEVKARLDRLRNDWKRSLRLFQKGFESAAVVDSAHHAFLAAKGVHQSAEAALEGARAKLKLAVVRAPISGIVLWEPLQPGTVVDRDVPVMSLVDDRFLWVVAYVPEDCRGKIHPGQAATVMLEGLPDQEHEGHVAFLFRGVKFRPRGLRTYDTPAETYQPVQIFFENADVLKGLGSIGMRAEVKIRLQ